MLYLYTTACTLIIFAFYIYIYIYVSPISQTGFTMPATTAEGQPAAVDGVAISNSVDIVDDTVDNWRRSRRQARYRVSVFVWLFLYGECWL